MFNFFTFSQYKEKVKQREGVHWEKNNLNGHCPDRNQVLIDDNDDDDDNGDNELLVDDVEASKWCGAGLHRMQHRSEPGRSFSSVFSSGDDDDYDDK